MRLFLAVGAIGLGLTCAALPALASLASNGLFDKGTALSDTHVEVVGIELPPPAR